MKKIIQIALWALSIFFCYMIVRSVTAPIEFNKTKQKRYTAVIHRLKDIRDAQEAHRVVTGKYASNFDELEKFIETSKFTITSQRDTSWTEYDKSYRIDVMKQGVVIDTLGYVSVKDSLFKDSDRYKKMRFVPYAQKKEQEFVMKSQMIDKNGYKVSVFEASVPKEIVLWDLDKEAVAQETLKNTVDDVKGKDIKVGSLDDVNSNGNWPTLYDAKTSRK
ncbi:hypothetical protein [Capnocytophaga canimorsus]|nr:hypothetical protein [Capnocytophaga canimorsus]ATA77624.1 hypothetical protein CGC47_08570 [Capnocytophaga canimorsus]ATA92258.1 hypothetical protein CGC56_08875 [Capnocytophaga canimorsus]AWL79095.1 hypothetical protein DKB58_09175 [Capnocytophaga canimorsus]AYW37689.1 hypothetical protein D8L92_10610 [Capnocytophaga canimorsus]MDT9499245.1 hypothetical protein [Capnocytophaga canimorsus]